MTDITCRIIVMKGKLFYTGTTVFPNGTETYKFSQHMYDAKKYRSLERAHRTAKRIGGCVRLMDALNGELI